MKKLLFIPVCLMLLVLLSCNRQEDKLQIINADRGDFPMLSAKKAIVRFSYEVERLHRNKTSASITAENSLNVPPTARHTKYFYEIYEDFSVGTASRRMKPTTSGYEYSEGDGLRLPHLITMADGMMKSFDSQGQIIVEHSMQEKYLHELRHLGSKEEIKDFVLSKYGMAPVNPAQTLKILKLEGMEIESAGSGVTIAKKINSYDYTLQTRTENNSKYIVFSEQVYINEEFGVRLKEEGFNANGELIDKLSYFYEYNDDGIPILAAEEYSQKLYSKTYDTEYLSISHFLYSNLEIH